MVWKLDKSRPLCPQIYEHICVRIACGELNPNERISSVREVALQAGVNPNTVQKAFEGLEQSGLIYSVRGSGWYVADNRETAEGIVKTLIRSKTVAFVKDMQGYGMSLDDIKKHIEEW